MSTNIIKFPLMDSFRKPRKTYFVSRKSDVAWVGLPSSRQRASSLKLASALLTQGRPAVSANSVEQLVTSSPVPPRFLSQYWPQFLADTPAKESALNPKP